MKIAVPWKLCCLPLTNVQGSQNGRFVNLHNSLKFQNSQKNKKYKITKIQKTKQNNFKITQNYCKCGSFLMIADPLWSCVMLLCSPLWSFAVFSHTLQAAVTTPFLQNWPFSWLPLFQEQDIVFLLRVSLSFSASLFSVSAIHTGLQAVVVGKHYNCNRIKLLQFRVHVSAEVLLSKK